MLSGAVRRKDPCPLPKTPPVGTNPAEDGKGEDTRDKRVEAEREIADNLITRLREFIDDVRDFEDAMTVEEYVVEVDVLPDGSIVDATETTSDRGEASHE